MGRAERGVVERGRNVDVVDQQGRRDLGARLRRRGEGLEQLALARVEAIQAQAVADRRVHRGADREIDRRRQRDPADRGVVAGVGPAGADRARRPQPRDEEPGDQRAAVPHRDLVVAGPGQEELPMGHIGDQAERRALPEVALELAVGRQHQEAGGQAADAVAGDVEQGRLAHRDGPGVDVGQELRAVLIDRRVHVVRIDAAVQDDPVRPLGGQRDSSGLAAAVVRLGRLLDIRRDASLLDAAVLHQHGARRADVALDHAVAARRVVHGPVAADQAAVRQADTVLQDGARRAHVAADHAIAAGPVVHCPVAADQAPVWHADAGLQDRPVPAHEQVGFRAIVVRARAGRHRESRGQDPATHAYRGHHGHRAPSTADRLSMTRASTGA